MKTGKTFCKIEEKERKGQNGTVLVIGGSECFTGAPIFSAKSALRSGSDMAFIMCPPGVVPVMKILLEAVVLPFAYNERILEKITACVVGPGLGRIENDVLETIIKILKFLNKNNIPVIIDADAIHYYKMGYFSFLNNAILTPNYKEKINLVVKKDHICIYKDENDLIVKNSDQYLAFNQGSKKRCGGQGDILTGILATAVSIDNNFVEACVSACELLRTAANISFKSKGYSLTTSDIIENITFALMEVQQN